MLSVLSHLCLSCLSLLFDFLKPKSGPSDEVGFVTFSGFYALEVLHFSGSSNSASWGSLHGVASLNVEEAHIAALQEGSGEPQKFNPPATPLVPQPPKAR